MIKEKTNYEIWSEGQLAEPAFRQEYERALDKLRMGSRIAQARQKRGLTQVQLARKIRTTKQEIDRLEMADYDELPFDLLKKVAAALELRLVVNIELREATTREVA